MKSLTFDAESHIYRLDGAAIPSVTQIARFCFADVDKSRPWLAEEAAGRGTRIHQCCMMIDYGYMPEIDSDCAEYIDAYLHFVRDYKPDWQYIETSGYCDTEILPFAGTVDRIGIIDGELSIVDIKSGQLHDAGLRAQLTGYSFFPCAGDVKNHYALQLRKDGTYKLQEVPRDNELFRACLFLHQSLQKKGRKKNGQ